MVVQICLLAAPKVESFCNAGGTFYVCAGMNQILSCSASGLPYPDVMISGPHSSVSSPNISRITLNPVIQKDSGIYTCSATNRHETVSEMCRVDIGGRLR